MSEFSSGLSLSPHGVDLAIGFRAPSEFPCRGPPPPLHEIVFAVPLPRRRLPAIDVERLSLLPRKTRLICRRTAVVTSRLIAQFKAASSRATAVTATFLGLPFLTSARSARSGGTAPSRRSREPPAAPPPPSPASPFPPAPDADSSTSTPPSAARPPVARLGDGATPDRVAGRISTVPSSDRPSTRAAFESSQIADLRQECRCRDQIDA